ncbi:MAG: HIT family hydrolase [Planctomycetaceae bacterium]|nr:HIT family hydrolase [Planctomycetaceae bacterium]
MNDQRLWAPWRLSYITGEAPSEPPLTPEAWQAGASTECFVCRAAASYEDQGAADQRNLVVARTEHALAVLNLYPYNNGHLLVCPLRHVAELHELTDDEHLAAMSLLAEYTQRYQRLIKAEGFNVGLNLGRIAGAGVPGHLHWHLVPRWPGDNNFMPTIAGVRMIPQSLQELWTLLTNSE